MVTNALDVDALEERVVAEPDVDDDIDAVSFLDEDEFSDTALSSLLLESEDSVPKTIIYVETLGVAKKACTRLKTAKALALDTETYPSGLPTAPALEKTGSAFTDPYTNKIRLVQIKAEAYDEIYLFDVASLEANKALEPLVHLLNVPHIEWIGWNLKFDYKMLSVNLGVKLKKVYDLQLTSDVMGYATGDQAYVARGRGLKDALRDFCNVKMSKKERTSNWGAPVLTQEQLNYAANDVSDLFTITHLFKDSIENEYRMVDAVALEQRVMPYVAEMELEGFEFDAVMFDKVQRAAKAALPKLEAQLCEWFGWPMTVVPPLESRRTGRKYKPMPRDYETSGSPLDSLRYLLKTMRGKGIPLEDTRRETLKGLTDRFPEIKNLLGYRDLTKQLSNSYLDWVNPQTGRIHPQYNQSGTTTGRFSSSNPNIQQVSKYELTDPDDGVSKINYRLCFRGPVDWKVIALDYSGQEISVMVALSGDAELIKILNQPAYIERDGKMVKNMMADIHAMTAELIYNKSHGITCWTAKDTPYPGVPGKTFRDIVKAIVFGLCVAEGTLVSTTRGLIPIEQVVVGDEAYTDKGIQPVTAVQSNGQQETLKLTLDNGQLLEVTPDHKIRVIDAEGAYVWRQAQHIEATDWVAVKPSVATTHTNAHMPTVEAHVANLNLNFHRVVKSEASRARVYDLTVANEHCFLANGVVVHNCYGKTEAGLAADFGITEDEARAIITAFYKPYPTLKKKLEQWGKLAAETSVAVFGIPETGLWRMRMVRSSRHSDKGAAERAGKNVPIQGTSALMMKLAICYAAEALQEHGMKTRLVGTVHDELIAFMPPDEVELASRLLGEAMDRASHFFLNGIVPDKHGKGIADTWTKD